MLNDYSYKGFSTQIRTSKGLYLSTIDIEKFMEILKHVGFSKIKVYKREVDCYLLIGEIDGEQVLISVRRGSSSNKLVAKVALAYKLPHTYWSCIYMEYAPQGLYVFRDSSDELAKDVVMKCKKLIEISKRESIH